MTARDAMDIILVNYQSTDYLLQCLRSIYGALENRSAHIFVVDNHSCDGVDRITRCHPGIRLIRNRHNIGFGAAVNQALRRTTSELILLLNPDSIVNPSLFSNSLEYMKKHPEIGVLGPRILEADGAIQQSARAFPTPLTGLFGRQSFLTRMFPNNPASRSNLLSDGSEGAGPVPVDWVSGACMMLRREALQDAGMFDERFFMYWEDADLCRRVHEKGWAVVYHPFPAVVHYVGKSSGKRFFQSSWAFHKSAFLLFWKHYPNISIFMHPIVFMGLLARLALLSILELARPALSSTEEKIRGDSARGALKSR